MVDKVTPVQVAPVRCSCIIIGNVTDVITTRGKTKDVIGSD